MSLFTRKMKLLTAVVLECDREKVTKALIAKGQIEFVNVTSLPDSGANRFTERENNNEEEKFKDLRKRIEIIFQEGHIEKPLSNYDSVGKGDFDYSEAEERLDGIYSALEETREKQRRLSKKIEYYEEILRYSFNREEWKYLDLRVGKNTKGDVDALLARLKMTDGFFLFDTEPYISFTLRRDALKIDDIFSKFSWIETSDREVEIKAFHRATECLASELNELKKEISGIKGEIEEKIKANEEELVKMWCEVRIHELSEHIQSKFAFTDHTVMFSGWMTYDKAEEITALIDEVTEGRNIMEYKESEEVDEEAPVLLESPKILKPFEKIVRNYAVPETGSINPTVFTAVSYMAMFTLMFADLGQGLVLLLLGLFGYLNYKKHPLKEDGILSRYLCSLLLFLGPASMLGGILFGSLFGFSIPPLWFPYEHIVNGEEVTGLISTVYDILAVTIIFGIVIIYLGLFINWINLVNKKRYFLLIFDKNGLLGGFLYALGIWFGYGFVRSGYREFPKSNIFNILLILAVCLLFLKVPIGTLINKVKGKETEKVGKIVIDTVMEFIVQGLEIFSGFLSNTLSFMRVAGLGIAHAALMSAFFKMAGMINNVVFFGIIIIVGNILVIALEGLSAGIQALRLNYYEFFTKYFTGHGTAFEPLGLESRIKVY